MRVFRADGSQVYFSGAVELLDHAGYLYLVQLADGSTAAMDEYSRVAATDVERLVTDGLTGISFALTSAGELYSSDGALLATDCDGEVLNMSARCEEGPLTGWKNSAGEWIICLINDTAD